MGQSASITFVIIVNFLFPTVISSLASSLWYLSLFLFFKSYSIIIVIIIIIICSLSVFRDSFSWSPFTGVWVTASLLKSQGLDSEWYQISSGFQDSFTYSVRP